MQYIIANYIEFLGNRFETEINILILLIISIYVLIYIKKNQIEYLFFATYPFLCKLMEQATLYFCLVIIIKNFFSILKRRTIYLHKEYFFLYIFMFYLICTIPMYEIDVDFLIGIRNLFFFALSGYFVIDSIRNEKANGNIVIFQSICSLLLSIYEVLVNSNQNYRSCGFFTNPNYYGFYLLFLMLMSIQFLKGKKRIIILGILSITIYLTLSSSCILVIIYMIYFYFFKGRFDSVIFTVIVSACLIVFFYLYKDPFGVYTYIDSQTDRLQIWSVYASIFFSSNMLFGVGFNKELMLYEKNLPRMKVYDHIGEIFKSAGRMPTHNEIFKVLIGTGLIGFLIFFMGYYIFTKKLSKNKYLPNVSIILLLIMSTHNVFFTFTFWLLMFYPLKRQENIQKH